jgi:hypothetical protein
MARNAGWFADWPEGSGVERDKSAAGCRAQSGPGRIARILGLVVLPARLGGQESSVSEQRWQVRLEGIYYWLFQGLYLTRDIPAHIQQGGFGIEQMEAAYIAEFPKSASYCWWGIALPHNAGRGKRRPICWSPDGSEILFSRPLKEGDKREGGREEPGALRQEWGLGLWSVKPDGSGEKLITTGWCPDWR